MTYTHMPFFISEQTGLFCVNDDIIKPYQNVTFRPWTPVIGTLSSYEPIDFPYKPNTPYFIPCSPVVSNGIISISYGSKVYTKEFNSNNEWVVVQEKVWQGYSDGINVNYASSNKCVLSGTEIVFPELIKTYRVVPCDYGHIVTGIGIDGNQKSYIVDDNLNISRLTSQGNNVYKSSICNGILYHSVKQNESIESYQIQTTENFEIESI